MSESRHPTTKLGRRRDPRLDTLPPDRPEERVVLRRTSRSGLPAARVIGKVTDPAARVIGKVTDPSARLAELERELAQERAERTAEADLLGQILARATQAEGRVALLEQSLARANEERAVAEGQLQSARTELERLLADAKASFDTNNLVTAVASERRFESRPQLQAVRALAADLLQSVDALMRASPSQRPRAPTVRPKGRS